MLHLITGGSGSGKSAFAEQCILNLGEAPRIYIATMYPFDEESRRRIARHRAMRREKRFTTIECFTGLSGVQVPSGANVLLECLSNLTANELYRADGAGEKTKEAILSGVQSLLEQAASLIIVTNEIFSDEIVYDPETVRYQKLLGSLNTELAKWADRVTEVACGIPLSVKGGER